MIVLLFGENRAFHFDRHRRMCDVLLHSLSIFTEHAEALTFHPSIPGQPCWRKAMISALPMAPTWLAVQTSGLPRKGKKTVSVVQAKGN